MTKPTREEALAHFGIKGMRWGVRNEDDISSAPKSSSKKKTKNTSKVTKEEYNELLKNQPKLNKAQQAKSIAKNKEKFKAKFESNPTVGKSEPVKKKGWRPNKNQLAIAGIGAAYIGLVAASYYADTKGSSFQGNSAIKNVLKNPVLNKPALAVRAGAHCDFPTYSSLIQGSISRSWGSHGYFNDYSWERPELSFPAGHVFHRLSNGVETGFGSRGTYCTSSLSEFARYLASSEFGNTDHHVSWRSTTEVRVPKLETVLETAKKALSDASGSEISTKEAFNWYKYQSGGGWDRNDTKVARFFDALKASGFHAIVDEMDAGVYSELPLVWFDSSAASSKQTSRLTKKDINEAKSILTEIAHRK